jgi:hypothetical protein
MAGLFVFFERTLIATVIVLAFSVYLLIRHARRSDGFWLFRVGQDRPSWETCARCKGMGVHMISGAPIPKQYRNRYTEGYSSFIQSDIANTVQCGNCLGHGGYWVYEDKTRIENIVPNKPFGGYE